MNANPKDFPAAPKRIDPTRFQLAEQARQIHFHTATDGTTAEDLLEPTYWALVAHKLRPFDRIEVVNDTGDFFVELLVLAVRPHESATVRGLRGIEINKDMVGAPNQSAPNTTGIFSRHKGLHLKWCAVRMSGDTEKVLRDKFETQDECHQWIAGHVAQQQARP
jgi:hypothetical protein